MSAQSEGILAGARGLKLYYRRWQPDAEPCAVVAIVHSSGTHHASTLEMENQLVSRGFAVYRTEHREHVRAPGQRGYLEEWSQSRGDVRALVQLVAEREGNYPRFLMGTSFGGFIALSYALHEPAGLTGVVALDPASRQPAARSFLARLGRSLLHLWPRPTPDLPMDVVEVRAPPAEVGEPALEIEDAHAGDLTLPHLILHMRPHQREQAMEELVQWLEAQL
jgi:alpha-beta hydrolase superfamily lysophospholipase